MPSEFETALTLVGGEGVVKASDGVTGAEKSDSTEVNDEFVAVTVN